MIRKGARPIFFVCAAVSDTNELVMKTIQASSPKEAASLFSETTGFKAKDISGPFMKKRAQVIENTRTLKFSDKTQSAIYNNWIVDAFFLKEPENHAYLVFIKRIDNLKQPSPKGTIIVPIADLRINNE